MKFTIIKYQLARMANNTVDKVKLAQQDITRLEKAGASLTGECLLLEVVSATTFTSNDSCSCCIKNENSFDCSTFLVSQCSKTEHQNQQQVL